MLSFLSYKDGIILPDRCGAYEPLAHNFNKDDIFAPVKWLSQPGGSLMLKNRYKFNVEIENETFSVVFSDGEMSPPKGILPKYLGKTTFWFSKQRKIDMVFLETLLRDFCAYLNADNGIIFDQETHEILVDIFQ